jgi:hypothetical protein
MNTNFIGKPEYLSSDLRNDSSYGRKKEGEVTDVLIIIPSWVLETRVTLFNEKMSLTWISGFDWVAISTFLAKADESKEPLISLLVRMSSRLDL